MATMRVVSLVCAAIVFGLATRFTPSRGQITTSCTSSLISSFTPCLNYITGSTNGGGGSPTNDCCGSLASLINSSAQCACLILTGNVPLSLPINRTLAVSLPRLCGGRSVPLQCSTAVGTNLPGPGPMSYAPSLPPLPPQPPIPAVGVISPAPSVTSSSLTPPPGIASPPSIAEGQRPFVLPSLAKEISTVQSLSMLAVSVLAVFF